MAKKTKKAEEVLNENNVNVTEEVVNDNATEETNEVVEETPNEENTNTEEETVDNKGNDEAENTSEEDEVNVQLTEITEEIPVASTESVEALVVEENVEKGPSEPIENEIPVRKRQRLTWEWNGMIADF